MNRQVDGVEILNKMWAVRTQLRSIQENLEGNLNGRSGSDNDEAINEMIKIVKESNATLTNCGMAELVSKMENRGY